MIKKINRLPRGFALGAATAAFVMGATLGAQAQDAALVERLLTKVDNPETLVSDVDAGKLAPVLVILKAQESLGGEVSSEEVANVQDRFLSSFLPKNESTGTEAERGLHRFSEVPFITLNANKDDLKRLADHPLVERIEPSFIMEPLLNQSVRGVGGAALHSKKGTGKGTTVVIIDTGVEAKHRFFGGRVVAEACFSVSIPNALESVCPNGKNVQIGPGAGAACKSKGCAHGTHVAGIAAGFIRVDDKRYLAGVAPQANIMAIQVFSKHAGRNGVGAHFNAILAGLDHVLKVSKTRKNIVSINVSIGAKFEQDTNCNAALSAMATIVKKLRKRNIATIIASGNSGTRRSVYAPSCLSQAITVGATDKKGVISHYSNMGKLVDLMAPGGFGRNDKRDILSAVTNNNFGYLYGTSMAAPHVAGAFAAIRSIRPNATVRQIEAAMKKAGGRVRDTRDNGTHSAPYLSIDKALAALDAGARVSSGKGDGGSDAKAKGASTTTTKGINSILTGD